MNCKKITALLVTLTILVSVLVMSVSATEGQGASDPPAEKFQKFIVNDQFNTDGDTQGWAKGKVKSGTPAFDVTQGEAPDGSKALIFTVSDNAPGAGGNEPNIFKEFSNKILINDSEDVEQPNQPPIVIKTRFMQTGNSGGTAGTSYLRFNQPNDELLLSTDNIPGGYPNMTTRINNANAYCDWFTLLKMEKGAVSYRTENGGAWAPTKMANVDTLDKWIEATITINSNKSVEISATINGTTYTKTDGSLIYSGNGPLVSYTLYNNPSATTALTKYPSLDSLTWISQTKNIVYVDYVQVYQEVDFVNAAVSVDADDLQNLPAKDPVVIAFDADTDVPSMPSDAFEIIDSEGNNVVTGFSYDSENKIVTLTQESFVPGGEYTLTLDGGKIKEETGLIIDNSSFALKVCDISVSKLEPKKEIADDGQKTVIADFEFTSTKDEDAENHQYQWQESATGGEGTFTDIDGATSKTYTYAVTDPDKYIRFKMIPCATETVEGQTNTYYGFETTSSVLAPEMAPEASDVTLSTNQIFEGVYVSVDYKYEDANDDPQGATEIKWLIADANAEGNLPESPVWTVRQIGDIYCAEAEDVGKFIKCEVTPVSTSKVFTKGAPAYSTECKIVDILASTNMYQDAGFESGKFEYDEEGNLKIWAAGNGYKGAEIQSKEFRTGSYALHLSPRTSIYDHFGQRLSFVKDNTYVFGAYAKKSRTKAQDINDVSAYAGGDTVHTSVGQSAYVLNDRWRQMVFAYKFMQTNSYNAGFVSWNDINTADFYIDDIYCGLLIIGDIETYDVEPITIPLSGETVVPVTSGQALNQLGKNYGLQDETVVLEIPEIRGVEVSEDGKNIVVKEDAYATEFTAKVYCRPKYTGATQEIFQKFIKIKLVAHDDPTPKALNVQATGVVTTDSVLTGTYDFYQIEQEVDESDYQWVWSDKENGVYENIPGATEETYTVTSYYADKYIKFAVIPKSGELEGTITYSNPLVAPVKPVAKNVRITGDMAIGSDIKGEYDFTDNNYDTEGTSIYRWLICDTPQGTFNAISGQESPTLRLTEDMQGKYIKFEVTPVSKINPETATQLEIDASVGQTELSNAVLGPVPPRASDVSITKDGNVLKGKYTYYHPHYIAEKGTMYEWKVNDVTVATTADYVVNFNGTKTVSFSVTPCAEDKPLKGETVTVSTTVTGSTGNSGAPSGGGIGGGIGGGVGGGIGGGIGGGVGGGIGGGTGSGTGVGVTNVNDMKIPEVEVQKPQEEQKPASDISGHWGETYINNMVSRGVMTADESGNYKPDENVSREIMLTYLFKALELESTEYKNEFSDVENGEFANMLQTMVDNGTIAKDTAFRPDDTISREEMCKILYISLKNANKLVETDEMVIEAFADYNNISEWARVYVNGIYANKIMVGVSDTEFDAKGTVTKAQAATMLTRILALTEEAK